MNLKEDFINLQNKSFFGASHWFFFVSISIVIFFFIIIIILIFKKGKIYGMISSFVFGILSMLILFYTLKYINWESEEIKDQVLQQTSNWLGIIGLFFLWAISIMIPIYMFIVVISFVVSDNIKKINKKTYATSFFSLMSLSFFGIMMALMMIPLIMAIPNIWFDASIVANNTLSVNEVVSYFTKWWLILGIVIFAIIVGFLIRFFAKKEELNSISNVFNKLLSYINDYFEYIIFFVPFVILTRFAMLGLSDSTQPETAIKLMASYMGIFWFGSLIIFVILFILNILLSNAKITKKEKSLILTEQVLNVFTNQNAQSSLPMTRICVNKLGVSEEISFLTPTQGTMMGMVMCNGFTPMLVVMLSMANYDRFDIWTVIAAIFIIMALSISTSGSGSADYTIILTTLGAFGISNAFYISVIMPVHEINERTIVKPNNTLGHIAATQITEITHRKFQK